MSESPETARILERVRKMLALARDKGATEGERDNAMRMAHATLAKYNLDLAAVESHEGGKPKKGPEARTDHSATFYGRPWARQVANSIAELCFCSYIYVGATKAKDTRHYFIGSHANATTAALLAEYVVESVAKEGHRAQRAAGAGNGYFRSFCWGAALTIRERCHSLREAAEKPQPNGDGKALVLASVYATEADANRQYLAQRFPRTRPGNRGQAFGAHGMAEGQAYGARINLNRQVQ